MAQRSLPLRAITRGPRYHWFGYYDKLQFDPTGRYVLGMEVDFEHRSPRPDDVIRVGVVDLQDGDRWLELGQSRAWCWQQGCMLQWRPGSGHEVLWNDRQGERFVCHILDIQSGARRTLPYPFYTLTPDGRTAVAPDFRRIQDMRPGYGYAGIPDPHRALAAPEDAGIWRLDLKTGEQALIVTLAQAVRVPYPHGDLSGAKHWFNHLLFNPDGSRFIFLHRWRFGSDSGFQTRMFTAGADGQDLRVVDDSGQTSHFIWRDTAHILAWSHHPSHGERFYLFPDGSGHVQAIGPEAMTRNGHCAYLPGNAWILNDTYPDAQRNQELYLYHTLMGRKQTLGSFHAPPVYTGEWRCDLHPRFSPDGSKVVIDSAHAGDGRQMYLLDISAITGDQPA